MTDENKDICPETPETPDLPETPEAAPEEPKEVVSWYIPQEPQGREVVSYYVQRDPMPQNVWQQAAKKEKRRSRLWLWISLAVLEADPQNPLPAAEFGNSDLVQVGDTAYAIGNPLGVELRGTMTNGIISAINRAVEVDGKSMTLLQTNAALNNGNSGGPLINAYGQVIGINTLKMSTTDSTEATVEGLGFALPISSVSFVVNDLIANGHYRGAPSLGITVTTVERDGGGTQVQVMEVSAGSGAADAGIQAGDVILAADGQAVSVTSDLLTARRSHIIGDTVTLTILRDGQQFDVEVTLRSNRSFG